MAVIDYFGIREATKTVLETEIPTATVRIEEEMVFGFETVPYIGIYLDRRVAPIGDQRIANGTRTDYNLAFSLWVVHFSMESLQKAIEDRDDMVSLVENALMKNRTLLNTVKMLWLEGGEFFSAKDKESGFLAIAEVNFTAQAIAVVV